MTAVAGEPAGGGRLPKRPLEPSRQPALTVRGGSLSSHRDRQCARIARRETREYGLYLSVEQSASAKASARPSQSPIAPAGDGWRREPGPPTRHPRWGGTRDAVPVECRPTCTAGCLSEGVSSHKMRREGQDWFGRAPFDFAQGRRGPAPTADVGATPRGCPAADMISCRGNPPWLPSGGHDQL